MICYGARGSKCDGMNIWCTKTPSYSYTLQHLVRALVLWHGINCAWLCGPVWETLACRKQKETTHTNATRIFKGRVSAF